MPQPRHNINELASVIHGGVYYAKLDPLGISPRDIIDFSVTHNPYGPPPGVLRALKSELIGDYPDPEARELKNCLSTILGVKPTNLLIGNGSTELIRLVATAFFSHGDSILIPQPTYSEYEVACKIVGAKVIKQPVLKEDVEFKLDIASLLHSIQKYKPKGVFLCNPNNPTGHCITNKDIERVLLAFPDCLFVVDEAYVAFTENSEQICSLGLIHNHNLIVVRSMTKDYGLAGLRLGYATAAPTIIETLRKVCPPWNVNTLAQLAGVAALRFPEYIEDCKAKLHAAKKFLVAQLLSMGLHTIPSQANFFLVKVGDAEGFYYALLRKGFLVRNCASFGIPEYIRLAPRTLAECEKLISAIREIIARSNS